MKRGFKTIVLRVHEDNLTYLKRELDAIAKKAANDEPADQAMWDAYSALHLAYDLLNQAYLRRRWIDGGLHAGWHPWLRIGRAHQFTISWGFSSRPGYAPGHWRRILWVRLWGHGFGLPLGKTTLL